MSATFPEQSGASLDRHPLDPRSEAATSIPPAARWYARLALVLGLGALVFVLIGGLKSLAVLIVGLAGIALALVGAWEFLRRVGAVRWIGAAVAIVTPIAVLVLYIAKHVWWQVLVALALLVAASWAARQALARTAPDTKMPESETAPPRRSFLVMNPRSGGGKVGQFSLDSRAAELGAQVRLLDGPGEVDVAALAREAVEDGADLLGVAGGDGTQALVAGIAAEHDLPFLVISAGTRNHFAMDLGLDRERPDEGLLALSDGVELCLDLGDINGRTFVNNASFGAYAEIVQSPAYRDDKVGTTLQMLPDLLSGQSGPQLRVFLDGVLTMKNPQAVLISNNPYEMGDLAGMGRRARIDSGVLGVLGISVANAGQAAQLVRGRRAGALYQGVACEVVIEADTPTIPVGIDGEAVEMATPVRCVIRPGALRVRVPRTRPGVPPPRRQASAMTLLRHALGTTAASVEPVAPVPATVPAARHGARHAARHRQPK